jgi:hypothetical protein
LIIATFEIFIFASWFVSPLPFDALHVRTIHGTWAIAITYFRAVISLGATLVGTFFNALLVGTILGTWAIAITNFRAVRVQRTATLVRTSLFLADAAMFTVTQLLMTTIRVLLALHTLVIPTLA